MSRARLPDFTPSEDTLIARDYADGLGLAQIGAKLERPAKAIQDRIYVLRRLGVIGGYQPRRRKLEIDTAPISMAPPLRLRNDEVLVARTLAEGGLPRAEVIQGATYWFGPGDNLWRHETEHNRNAGQRCGRVAA